MDLFVVVLMISLFCFRFFIYFVIVGDSFNESISVVPLSSSWEKEI